MKKTLLLLICALGINAFISEITWGQTYPEKPIVIVVPFAAGSGTDSIARVISQKLSDKLKQAVVVDNKAGANALIGVEYVAKAAPDGYTLLMTTATSHSANPWLFKNLRYDAIKDFTPIARTGVMPFVLVTKASSSVKSIKDLIELAKANPGKLSFASPNGTSMLAGEAIGKLANVEMINTPYKSAPQAMNDLLAGHLDFYVVDFAVSLPYIQNSMVNALGVTNLKRSALLPEVPAFSETIPGFDLNAWNGFFGPANLPVGVVEKLSSATRQILLEKDTVDKLSKLGFEVQPSLTPEEFSKYVVDQLAYWGKMMKLVKIQAQ
jgi:tripartite-type tricarboxylate transporter receptor subunit TctC